MAKAVTIYGIKNCDTMKKARAWLDGHGVAYGFHDYKAAGIERRLLESWAKDVAGRRCSTAPARPSASCPRPRRRGLDPQGHRPDARPALDDQAPVLEAGGKMIVGFKPEIYAGIFGKA